MSDKFKAEFCIHDETADRIIESGRYWVDETTFSAYKVTSGYDPDHYLSFDVNRGPEESGWTLFSTPGTFQVRAGAKTPPKSGAVNFFAENGDVNITCLNGDIRLKARNIHIDASLNVSDNRNGIVHIKGSEKVSIHAPTVEVEAKRMLRVVSSGNFVLDISNVSELNMGMCKAFSNSSADSTLSAAIGVVKNFV